MMVTPMPASTPCLMACVLFSSRWMLRAEGSKPPFSSAISMTFRVPDPCSRVMNRSVVSSSNVMLTRLLHGWSMGTTITSSSCQKFSITRSGS